MIKGEQSARLLKDIHAAEMDFGCTLERVTAYNLIVRVSTLYSRNLDFEELLEAVIFEQILDEAERHAYKRVLGQYFGRRSHAKRT